MKLSKLCESDDNSDRNTKIIEMAANGMTNHEIMAVVGLSYNTVDRIIQTTPRTPEQDAAIKSHRFKSQDRGLKQQIIDAANSGLTASEISDKLGANKLYVYRVLKDVILNPEAADMIRRKRSANLSAGKRKSGDGSSKVQKTQAEYYRTRQQTQDTNIANLAEQGLSNQEIADKLQIGLRAVHFALKRVGLSPEMEKLRKQREANAAFYRKLAKLLKEKPH